MFLAFLVITVATDALAGLLEPTMGSGERYRIFVERYYGPPLNRLAHEMWRARNLMVHAFNPGTFGLVCGQPHVHQTFNSAGMNLDVQLVHESLAMAAKAYFQELESDATLQDNFMRRIGASEGGAPQVHTVVEFT